MDHLPTSTAFRKARRKLLPSAFVALNQGSLDIFESTWAEDDSLRTWQGYRVFAVDGSYLNFEPTPDLKGYFGEKQGTVQGLASFLFDVLNELVYTSSLVSIKRSEKSLLFNELQPHLKPGSVLVLDRLYGDFSVLSFLVSQGCEFVIRLQKNTFKEARDLLVSGENERTCLLRANYNQKPLVQENGWPLEIPVRFVKVVNAKGETEVLATSLTEVSPEALYVLYGKRWGIETYFDRLKNLFELERWSGGSVQAVEQDFHGLIYLSNLESMIASEAEEELPDERYTVNRAMSTAVLLDYLVSLLMDPSLTSEEVIEKIEKVLIQQPLLRAKPDRHFPRKKPGPGKLNRYFRYRKRLRP